MLARLEYRERNRLPHTAGVNAPIQTEYGDARRTPRHFAAERDWAFRPHVVWTEPILRCPSNEAKAAGTRRFRPRYQRIQEVRDWLAEKGGFEPSRLFISRSFYGLRAISTLWKALASVRTSKKFCVGVGSPLLDDGPGVPAVAS
jgi:hypothetical protein